jgi:hypothetical protein
MGKPATVALASLRGMLSDIINKLSLVYRDVHNYLKFIRRISTIRAKALRLCLL